MAARRWAFMVAAGEFAAGQRRLCRLPCHRFAFGRILSAACGLWALISHVAMNGMAASGKIFRLLDLPEAPEQTAALVPGGGIAL